MKLELKMKLMTIAILRHIMKLFKDINNVMKSYKNNMTQYSHSRIELFNKYKHIFKYDYFDKSNQI